MLEPGLGPRQDSTRLQTTRPGDPDSWLLLELWAAKRTQERDALVLALVLTRVNPAAFQPAAPTTALQSPEGALFTPVPPTARLTPQANPSPLPSQASLSPVTSGLNYPLLSQVVLDPRDTCTHHHGALSCTRQGLPPGRGRSLGEDPPSAKAMSSHVGHGCEAHAQGPAWGRERKVDCLCTEGTRQRARPDARDGHFRKPPRGPGDDLVTGQWTCQVSVKT